MNVRKLEPARQLPLFPPHLPLEKSEDFQNKDVKNKGQVFTPRLIAQKMIGLRQNFGSALEPSAGAGAFLAFLGKNAVGIELDGSLVCDPRTLVCDFFKYPVENKFQTVIGNPPYVRFQDIQDETKNLLNMRLFDKRSNLYLFFIAKSIEHLSAGGELIFITPRDFLKSTNAKKLNQQLYAQGSFTHFYELGDAYIFKGYSPNCAIWRWQKGLKKRKMSCGRKFFYSNGQIGFCARPQGRSILGDYFDVKVGAVSGADDVFSHKKYGNVEMVCSLTRKTGYKRKMIYNKKCAWLEPFKNRLLKRKVKTFNQSNWWTWGRNYFDQEGERIYVNCKTRQARPFFVSADRAYDGSVLALFPKNKNRDLAQAAHKLNHTDWRGLGFVCGGRLLFTQRSLSNAPIDKC